MFLLIFFDIGSMVQTVGID